VPGGSSAAPAVVMQTSIASEQPAAWGGDVLPGCAGELLFCVTGRAIKPVRPFFNYWG